MKKTMLCIKAKISNSLAKMANQISKNINFYAQKGKKWQG